MQFSSTAIAAGGRSYVGSVLGARARAPFATIPFRGHYITSFPRDGES